MKVKEGSTETYYHVYAVDYYDGRRYLQAKVSTVKEALAQKNLLKDYVSPEDIHVTQVVEKEIVA